MKDDCDWGHLDTTTLTRRFSRLAEATAKEVQVRDGF